MNKNAGQMGLPGIAPPPVKETVRAAWVSEDGRYRYTLDRTWDDSKPVLVFCLLNPSTADALKDDTTSRRCEGFARAEGYGGLRIVNLFAWRATHPDELLEAHARGEDIHGPENAKVLAELTTLERVVVAWGTNAYRKPLRAHAEAVCETLKGRMVALSVTTIHSYPEHPSRLPGAVKLAPWEPLAKPTKEPRKPKAPKVPAEPSPSPEGAAPSAGASQTTEAPEGAAPSAEKPPRKPRKPRTPKAPAEAPASSEGAASAPVEPEAPAQAAEPPASPAVEAPELTTPVAPEAPAPTVEAPAMPEAPPALEPMPEAEPSTEAPPVALDAPAEPVAPTLAPVASDPPPPMPEPAAIPEHLPNWREEMIRGLAAMLRHAHASCLTAAEIRGLLVADHSRKQRYPNMPHLFAHVWFALRLFTGAEVTSPPGARSLGKMLAEMKDEGREIALTADGKVGWWALRVGPVNNGTGTWWVGHPAAPVPTRSKPNLIIEDPEEIAREAAALAASEASPREPVMPGTPPAVPLSALGIEASAPPLGTFRESVCAIRDACKNGRLHPLKLAELLTRALEGHAVTAEDATAEPLNPGRIRFTAQQLAEHHQVSRESTYGLLSFLRVRGVVREAGKEERADKKPGQIIYECNPWVTELLLSYVFAGMETMPAAEDHGEWKPYTMEGTEYLVKQYGKWWHARLGEEERASAVSADEACRLVKQTTKGTK